MIRQEDFRYNQPYKDIIVTITRSEIKTPERTFPGHQSRTGSTGPSNSNTLTVVIRR